MLPRLYYFAAYTDSGCLISCGHEHPTVISAVACVSCAGAYVIAVEKNQLRELNAKEEKDFQFAMYGSPALLRRLGTFIPFRLLKLIFN